MTGLGEVRVLKIKELLDFGATLDNMGSDLFIPQSDLTPENEVGDELEVFIFENKEKNSEATTQIPVIKLNEAGVFKVDSSTQIGAFVDIGSKRQVLIPPREMQRPLREGEKIVMTLRRDDQKQMLFGSTRLRAYYKNYGIKYERGDKLRGMVIEKTDLGRRVLVEGKHVGLIMEREIYTNLHMGDMITVYMREVKDKDLYIGMHMEGAARVDEACQAILDFVEFHNGYARLHDDSPSEEINLRLKMSKKTFKKACGKLYKEGKLVLTKRGIKLPKTDEEREVKKEWVARDPRENKPAPDRRKDRPTSRPPLRKTEASMKNARNLKGRRK